jgi:dipeptidyl aminopeptidase/acylaminoacyl peptidase
VAVLDADGRPTIVGGFAVGADFAPETPVAVGALAAVGNTGTSSVAVVTSAPVALPSIDIVDVDTGRRRVVRGSDDVGIDRSWLSTAQAIRFPSEGRDTHCFFYPPTSEGNTPAAEGGRPPLIVMGHGGPTSHTDPSVNLKIQYWTSRGFAVADVNYGGSTGFGKEYRDRLHLRWGQVDVEDCVNAARHLAASDLVDGNRLAIRGSSSGGFTVLRALLDADCFAAGTSLYGIADLAAMVADTHKFESRYFDWLIGPFPQQTALYRDRSPITQAQRLTTPMLIMQGSDDKVVPPSQSEAVVAALAANHVAHAYALFDGEPHGFRQAETLIRSLELELWFYGQIFGFEPADAVEPPDHASGLGSIS